MPIILQVAKVGNTVIDIHDELGNFRKRQALDPEVPGSSPTIALGG
ncbi:hypothetical protein A2U01_0055998, partial [Trifolium medium]|nr:hypothetical protein [Trifolium medium]